MERASSQAIIIKPTHQQDIMYRENWLTITSQASCLQDLSTPHITVLARAGGTCTVLTAWFQ
jgi:hypothetical protein